MKKNHRLALFILVALIIIGIVGFFVTRALTEPASRPEGRRGFDPNRVQPVRVAVAQIGNIDLTVNALGTVTARNTTIVRSRVDGPLVNITFREGQFVKAGDLLAEIDPRTFQTALDQAKGQLARDQAQLAAARINLDRYRELLTKDAIAKQQVDDQQALVEQLQGTVLTDQAQVNNAQLQLEFTRVTAPISGRLGLRQVDLGNMIRSSDANGVVVITQTRPITVIFSVPSQQLSTLLPRWQKGNVLPVEAFDRDGKIKLAEGKLASVDNQIDVTTGTIRLKAEFSNTDDALFPNQFVNARLKVDTLQDVVLIPSAAIQRGAPGIFVYVVKSDNTVELRRVVLGPSTTDTVAISNGVMAGERVVIDGMDRLREGAKVELPADTPQASGAAPGERRGGRRRGDGSGPRGNRGDGGDRSEKMEKREKTEKTPSEPAKVNQ